MKLPRTTLTRTIKRAGMLLAGPALLAGCMMWSRWEVDSSSYKDMPYANGERVVVISRERDSPWSPTGRQGESAFRIGGRPVYRPDLGKEALGLMHARPDREWRIVDRNYDGVDRWFAPVRIFAPSVRPMILMTIPWSYRGDPAMSQVRDEIRRFSEGYDSTYGYGMMNHVELRDSLPKEAQTVRIISKNAATTVEMPVDRARHTTIVFDGRKITFERTASGTVTVGFARN